MKFVLLITMLALNGVDALCWSSSVDVTFEGTLTCPHRFYALVEMEEWDTTTPDDKDIAWKKLGPVTTGTANFKISGIMEDDLQCHVEPRLVVKHTCHPTGEEKCVYKQFEGVSGEKWHKKIDIDLINNDLKKC